MENNSPAEQTILLHQAQVKLETALRNLLCTDHIGFTEILWTTLRGEEGLKYCYNAYNNIIHNMSFSPDSLI